MSSPEGLLYVCWEINICHCVEVFDIDTSDSVNAKAIKTVNLNEVRLSWITEEIAELLKLRHLNIMQLYGAVKDENFYYLVMEKCDEKITNNLRQLPVSKEERRATADGLNV